MSDFNSMFDLAKYWGLDVQPGDYDGAEEALQNYIAENYDMLVDFYSMKYRAVEVKKDLTSNRATTDLSDDALDVEDNPVTPDSFILDFPFSIDDFEDFIVDVSGIFAFN